MYLLMKYYYKIGCIIVCFWMFRHFYRMNLTECIFIIFPFGFLNEKIYNNKMGFHQLKKLNGAFSFQVYEQSEL